MAIYARAKELGLTKDYPKVLCVETGQIFKNATEAGKAMNIPANNPRSAIYRVCQGERATAYGYHWKFIKEE